MQNPATSTDKAVIELEQKFHLRDVAALERQLSRLAAEEGCVEHHRDTYYRHPARDFAQTREALRIRRVLTESPASGGGERPAAGESATLVTYKGPYTPAGVKARPELQWRIDPCDPDGGHQAQLFHALGFREVFTVQKTRRSFSLEQREKQLTITIDATEGLGIFAEVETLASGEADCAACAALVASVAEQLGLREAEKRSYLQMSLEAAGVA